MSSFCLMQPPPPIPPCRVHYQIICAAHWLRNLERNHFVFPRMIRISHRLGPCDPFFEFCPTPQTIFSICRSRSGWPSYGNELFPTHSATNKVGVVPNCQPVGCGTSIPVVGVGKCLVTRKNTARTLTTFTTTWIVRLSGKTGENTKAASAINE